MEKIGPLRVRRYGEAGALIIVLHGGPAAPGSAQGIARGLADTFRVLEPWQRGSGEAPLTVAQHVEDLHQLIKACGLESTPGLVGWSWGAMLALAYAAAHPDDAGPLVLVGCGTFDRAARARMQTTLDERIDDDLRRHLERIEKDIADPNTRLSWQYELTSELYDYDPLTLEGQTGPEESLDVQAHQETWADMVRLQDEGVYPASFSAIKQPVLMLHGAYDPHPGRMIFDSLRRHIPQLDYHEWENCGHSPWLEKHVHAEFFATMRQWLRQHLGS